MIDWNDNAKAAVWAFAAHVGYERTAKLWLEGRGKGLQTKTVADSSQQSCSEEGEKWTHEYGYVPCRIEIEKQDEHGYIVIYVQGDGYLSCEPDDIKPIKQQITKAQAWDKVQEMSLENVTCYYACTYINEKYEVIDD